MGWDPPPLMQPRSHQAMQAIPAGPAHRAERETAWVAGRLVLVVGALGCLGQPQNVACPLKYLPPPPAPRAKKNKNGAVKRRAKNGLAFSWGLGWG